MKRRFIVIISFLIGLYASYAQEYYVHPYEGLDTNTGSKEQPFKSIQKAVEKANRLTGEGDITIYLMPGTYVLQDKVVINPVRILKEENKFILKAYHMPDDADWSPELMPAVQSVSSNNSSTFFNHSVGFLVASDQVSFEGIRFLGNANPQVKYYYPITKEDMELKNLSVSQCMFVGDKESAKIQGAIWAHGPNTTIDHCIFYECRNALLFFDNVAGFSVTNSIIARSYESAFWLGPDDMEFEFYNNVLLENSNFVVGRSADLKYSSPFKESVISDENNNDGVGYWSREKGGIVPIKNPKIKMTKVDRQSKMEIIENEEAMAPKNHLHLTNWTINRAEPGIFKTHHK